MCARLLSIWCEHREFIWISKRFAWFVLKNYNFKCVIGRLSLFLSFVTIQTILIVAIAIETLLFDGFSSGWHQIYMASILSGESFSVITLLICGFSQCTTTERTRKGIGSVYSEMFDIWKWIECLKFVIFEANVTSAAFDFNSSSVQWFLMTLKVSSMQRSRYASAASENQSK